MQFIKWHECLMGLSEISAVLVFFEEKIKEQENSPLRIRQEVSASL